MQIRSLFVFLNLIGFLHIAQLHFRCLVKNPDHRPVMMEIGEHPFIQELPEDTITVATQFQTILLNIHQVQLNLTCHFPFWLCHFSWDPIWKPWSRNSLRLRTQRSRRKSSSATASWRWASFRPPRFHPISSSLAVILAFCPNLWP